MKCGSMFIAERKKICPFCKEYKINVKTMEDWFYKNGKWKSVF